MGKITIYDIAKALNLTAPTVSRALNDSPNISEATKTLVKEKAKEMNYEQNKLALALKKGKSFNVGVIVPRIDSNFFSTVIRGIEEELNQSGYHVIICQTGNDVDKESENIEALLNSQVDAIFISTSSDSEKIFEKVQRKNVSLVFFDRALNMPKVSAVTIDDYKAGYIATKHLIEEGYQRIAHFSGDLTIEIFNQRFAGYKQALTDNGLQFDEKLHIKLRSNIEDGKQGLNKLMSLNTRPDALFSSSDFAALGAIQELKSMGINVPNEFGVVGFSNEPFTKFMELTISTIDQFPLEMGKNVAKVFLEQTDNKDKVKIEKKVVVEPELIIRKSSSRT